MQIEVLVILQPEKKTSGNFYDSRTMCYRDPPLDRSTLSHQRNLHHI